MAGRDGAFTGIWTPHGCETLGGRFVIQCKFTSKKEQNLHAADLTVEVEKVRRLVAKGLCDCYLLLTNAGVSGTEAEKIDTLYRNVGVESGSMARPGFVSRFGRAGGCGCSYRASTAWEI